MSSALKKMMGNNNVYFDPQVLQKLSEIVK